MHGHARQAKDSKMPDKKRKRQERACYGNYIHKCKDTPLTITRERKHGNKRNGKSHEQKRETTKYKKIREQEV